MKNYENNTPSYFATRTYTQYPLIGNTLDQMTLKMFASPLTAPVQLIYALENSLETIINGKVSLEERLQMHRDTSKRFKNAMKDLGFKMVSVPPSATTAIAKSLTSRIVVRVDPSLGRDVRQRDERRLFP